MVASPAPQLSSAEERAAHQRVFQDAYDRLVIGPGKAFLAAGCAVFGVGCLEGWQYLKPQTSSAAPASASLSVSQKCHFIARYGLAQVIPSLIWGQQPARTVAQVCGVAAEQEAIKYAFFGKRLPPMRQMAVNRLIAIRGAIAGTILISQVISFASVSSEAKAAYSKRIEAGRERPLDIDTTTVQTPSNNNDHHLRQGVVIRLAGKTSDVTSLSMNREGRQHLFPVFEDPSLVQPLLRRHGVQLGNYYMVPLFWHVQDKRYAYPESWSELSIPRSWLFDVASTNRKAQTTPATPKRRQLLVLEADANRDDAGALSLDKSQVTANLDLDLYEVAQGFYQLQQLVEESDDSYDNHQCLCVLLADAESIIQRGGGEQMMVRDYVFRLGLADIVIDTQAPIVLTLKQWLESKKGDNNSKRRNRKHVILETPEVQWFQSMKKGLKQMGGYEVIDTMEAVRLYGSARDIPMLVYERASQDTKHTITRLVHQNITTPDNVCGLCSSYQGLEESDSSVGTEEKGKTLIEVANICSSDLHDRLFRKVREAAMRGQSKEEIQRELDENLATMLEKSSDEKDWKLRLRI